MYLGNRVQDRLSVLVSDRPRTAFGLDPDGTGSVLWPDGTRVWSSVDYVHLKDRHLHSAVMETLGAEPLEGLFDTASPGGPV